MRQRRTIIRVYLLAALAVLTSLSAACASQVDSGPLTAPVTGQAKSSSQAGQSGQSGQTSQSGSIAIGGRCPDTATDPAVVKLKTEPAEIPLPAGFHAVAAVRCVTQQRAVSGDGEWQFADAQRADSGLAALLSSLRLPSKTPPAGTLIACAAIGLALPPFALVDASGAIVRPQLPHDECGMPLTQVLTAMNALPWRTETEQRLNQLQTQPEIDTGCSPMYKDLFKLPVQGTPKPRGPVRHPYSPGPMTICAYTVVPANGTLSDGAFAHGVKLSAAQLATVNQALGQAGNSPAPACATSATRFAVLIGPGADGIAVELDGCHRLWWPEGFTDAAPASLLRALAAAGVS